jgi:hypothetical protein
VQARVAAGDGLEGPPGRQARLSAALAARLGVSPGAVVELVNPRGAPLRAWVAAGAAPARADAALVAELAPLALRMLAAAEGAEVEVRAVHSGVLGGRSPDVAG